MMIQKHIKFEEKQDWTVEAICKNCGNWAWNYGVPKMGEMRCTHVDSSKTCDNFSPPLKPLYQKMSMRALNDCIDQLDIFNQS